MPWLGVGHVYARFGLTRVRSAVPSALPWESSAFCSQFVMLPQAHLPPGSKAQGRQKGAQKPRQVPLDEVAAAVVIAFICQVPADFLMLCQGKGVFPVVFSLKSECHLGEQCNFVDALRFLCSHSNSKNHCSLYSLPSNEYWYIATLRKRQLTDTVLVCFFNLGLIWKHFPGRYLTWWVWKKRE